MILGHLLIAAHILADIRLIEDIAEVEATRLPVVDGLARLEPIDAPDHFFDLAEAQLRHDLAHILGNEAHEIDHVFRLAGEALTQPRILGRDTDRASVEMTDAHQNTADTDQRCGRETEFFGAEQGGDDDIAAGL